jgi:hypothetical protein
VVTGLNLEDITDQLCALEAEAAAAIEAAADGAALEQLRIDLLADCLASNAPWWAKGQMC